jgi:hypothetical protein
VGLILATGVASSVGAEPSTLDGVLVTVEANLASGAVGWV